MKPRTIALIIKLIEYRLDTFVYSRKGRLVVENIKPKKRKHPDKQSVDASLKSIVYYNVRHNKSLYYEIYSNYSFINKRWQCIEEAMGN